MDINYENLNAYHATLSERFFGALASAPPGEHAKISTAVPSSSSRNQYPFLGEIDKMRKWTGPRITKEMTSYDYSIKNEKYELTMEVERTELADDMTGQISVYGARAAIFGRSVAQHPDELMIEDVLPNGDSYLCYDGHPFFYASHPTGKDGASTAGNVDSGGSGSYWYLFDTSKSIMPLIYQLREAPEFNALQDLNNPMVFMNDKFYWGARTRDAGGFGLWQLAYRSNQALTAANFLAARQAMRKITNDQGVNMRIEPTQIWVPRDSLADDARKLFTSDYLSVASGSTENNYLKGAVEVVVSQYLPFV